MPSLKQQFLSVLQLPTYTPLQLVTCPYCCCCSGLTLKKIVYNYCPYLTELHNTSAHRKCTAHIYKTALSWRKLKCIFTQCKLPQSFLIQKQLDHQWSEMGNATSFMCASFYKNSWGTIKWKHVQTSAILSRQTLAYLSLIPCYYV
jgi:hypothetical protein